MTKFFLDQHGCAKNQVDGELLISHLVSSGLEQTFVPEEAGLIIINSCGFIESAKKESLDSLFAAKEAYPHAKILLAGCLAERYADAFRSELPEADGILGNGDLSDVTTVVSHLLKGERSVVVSPQKGVCCGDRNTLLSFRGSTYVKITEGCNNWCSFCAIPLIRGQLRSRKASDIISEIKQLLSEGIFEINLIGQDLAAYGTGNDDNVFGTGKLPMPDINRVSDNAAEESGLVRLLKDISGIPGNFWVRLLYIHPDHFDRNILSVMKDDKRILPYFDIPFQSGDDTIIRSMNRKGSAAQYLQIASDIRAAFPDAALRTTFLTGFPGETDENASRSRDFLEKLQSDWSGCFSYSKEEGTRSSKFPHTVPAKTAKLRADTLTELQSSITRKHLELRTKKEYDVLVEELIAGEDGLAIGRAWFEAPDVDGSVVIRYDRDDETESNAVQPGRLVRVKAVASGDVDIDAIFTADSPLNTDIHSNLKFASEITDGKSL